MPLPIRGCAASQPSRFRAQVQGSQRVGAPSEIAYLAYWLLHELFFFVQDAVHVGMADRHTAAHLVSHPGTSGLWQHHGVAGGRRLAAPSLQDVLAAMSPQMWDVRTNSTSSAETAEVAALQPMEGLTPTPASTPHASPGGTPLGLAGQPAPGQPGLSQHPLHPLHQRSALPSCPRLAVEGDTSAKKAAVRPRELRITATSGIGTLLEAINVLGASSTSLRRHLM